MNLKESRGRIAIKKDGNEGAYLAKLFGVTRVMVWKALAFESDTDLAKKNTQSRTGARRAACD